MEEVLDKVGKLSLSEAINYIEKYSEEKLPYNGGASANLFASLKDGSITARGFYRPDFLIISKIDQEIPVEYWQKQHYANFILPIIQPNQPSYLGVYIVLTDLERWIKNLTNLSVIKADYSQVMDLASLKQYYSRFITDGNIKAHRLAALIVGAHPIGNISSTRAEGEGIITKTKEQPHAKQITHAPMPKMPSKNKKGQLMPVARNA